jgi:hypothetical protein
MQKLKEDFNLKLQELNEELNSVLDSVPSVILTIQYYLLKR